MSGMQLDYSPRVPLLYTTAISANVFDVVPESALEGFLSRMEEDEALGVCDKIDSFLTLKCILVFIAIVLAITVFKSVRSVFICGRYLSCSGRSQSQKRDRKFSGLHGYEHVHGSDRGCVNGCESVNDRLT